MRVRALAMAAVSGFTALALGLLPACDDDDAGESAGAAEAAASDGLATHLDLLALAHLADVEHHGLFIDFGTPAQAKYTVGDWESGWGSRGTDGDVTFANAGRRGRVYFHLDAPAALDVTLRLRPRGTRAVTPYINNTQVQSVFFEGEGWQDVSFTLPASDTQRGENYLLLTFGGVDSIGGEDVSVQLASARLAPEGAPADVEPPAWGTTAGEIALGGTTKAALAYRAPLRFRYLTQVPRGGRLVFHAGQEGAADAARGTGRVFVTAEGGSRTKVWEGRLGAGWERVSVDLGAYAGKVVALELEAEGGTGRAAFAEAQIRRPPLEVPEHGQAKNVVVLLIDTLRASKLKAWNRESRVRTPVLDGLAEEGVVFERAMSTDNWTKPSVAGIFTGLHPTDHGANTQAAVLSDAALTLPEHFAAQGFATGGFVANGYVSDRFGFEQGFAHYRNFIRENVSVEAEDVFRTAGDWALQQGDERFFLYIQTIDPHVPYDPDSEYVSLYDSRSNYEGIVAPRRTGELLVGAKERPPTVTFSASDVRRLRALHDGEITQHDKWLGVFIERMKSAGLWDDTLLVVVSDHGEEFDEHGSWGHGHSIYQELLHVPLLVHQPRHLPARRVAATVSTMDIAPTVLELAGLSPMPGITARSLVPLAFGQEPYGPQLAMSEFREERRVIFADQWKFFVRGNLTAAMFDLEADPNEENQLDVHAHPIAARYLRVMQGQFLGASNRAEWLAAEQQARRRIEGRDVQMDDELQQQLRELGYLN
ncbi:MAG: sulfatase [Myxococcota bacterium]